MSLLSSRPRNNTPTPALPPQGGGSVGALPLQGAGSLRKRRGNILLIVAGGLTALLGMGALVCDVGIAYAQKTKMQSAADAAALAAVTRVNEGTMCQLEGMTYAKFNGFMIGGNDIHPNVEDKSVTVAWKQPTGFLLAPIFNIFNAKVGVESTAALVPIQQKLRVAPFLVSKDKLNLGSIMTIKYGPGDGHFGNYGAAAIDGPGAKIYQTSIEDGANTQLKTGMFVNTEPGDMRGPTDKGVNDLIAGDNTPYEEALTTDNKRLVVVLLVDDNDFQSINGRSEPILIRGFARFYLMGSQDGVVTGRFIDEKFGNNAPPPRAMRAKLVR